MLHSAGASRALESVSPAPAPRQWNEKEEQRADRILAAVNAFGLIAWADTDEQLARALVRNAEAHARLWPDELLEAYRMEQRIPKRYTVGVA